MGGAVVVVVGVVMGSFTTWGAGVEVAKEKLVVLLTWWYIVYNNFYYISKAQLLYKTFKSVSIGQMTFIYYLYFTNLIKFFKHIS